MRKDERTEEILARAAEVFCEKGYDRASIRDIARASEMSLAGLYYHFDSKEDLLFRIQERVFGDLIEGAKAAVESAPDPVRRLEAFIRSHVSYFLGNLTDMKVLSHDYHRLKGEEHAELHRLRREYYGLATQIVAAVMETRGLDGPPVRVTVLSLFGMMNWLYTWYRPGSDPAPDGLARDMASLFLNGLLAEVPSAGD